MVQPRIERKLVSVVVADVVGFSRLTELDEEGTHARLNALQRDVELILDGEIRASPLYKPAARNLGRSGCAYSDDEKEKVATFLTLAKPAIFGITDTAGNPVGSLYPRQPV